MLSAGIGGAVAHAVSASYVRSERMSPEGMALALLLHALAAFLLWWMSQHRPPILPTEDVVEVSFELPKAPEPPPPAPAPAPTPAPTAPPPPPIEGIRPPAEITSDTPTQVRPTSQNPTNQNIPLSAPQSLERAIPKENNEPPPPTSQAFAQPQPQPAPTPPQASAEKPTEKAIEQAFQQAMPPLPKPEPPKPEAPKVEAPKPPPPKPAPPQQHAAIAVPPANPSPRPPAPYQPRPSIAPSPLSRLPQQRQATATARGAEAPQTSPFVNPADTYNKARVGDNYLWEVVRRLQGYEYQANLQVAQAVTVVSVTIARDGRLLNVVVLSSSGYPELDQGVLAGVRSGSPYTPLPDSIPGPNATFRLPLVSSRAR